MKIKKVVAIALVAAAAGCFCLFPTSAAENSTYSKSISVKEGQVVTAKIYVNVDNPVSDDSVGNLVSGIEYGLLRDHEALSFTEKTLNASPEELCPDLPNTLINLHSNENESLFSFMDVANPKDFTDLQLMASLDFNAEKTGITTLSPKVRRASHLNMAPDDDTITDHTPYSSINLEIYIDGYMLGDCDKNTVITVSDAIEIQKGIAGITELDPLTESLADTTGDGLVTVADAIKVQQYIANIIGFI